jgi:NTP pyrophosphatase (non-canonical NTP hydrolase)
VLICLANQTGVDLGKSLEQIMEKRTIRDQNRHKENQKINNELE